MSHSVIITLQNTRSVINTCNNLANSLKESMNYNWSDETKESMNNHLKIVESEKSKILSMIGQKLKEQYEIDRILSTISKEIENLELSLNFKGLYDDYIKENSGKIEEIIATYGILATESLGQLILNNEKISVESLMSKIDEMRDQEASSDNLKKYQEIFKTNILKSDFSDDIKLQFINLSKQFKNIQEISDVQPLIASKVQEFDNMKIMVKDIVKILAKLDFKIASKNNYTLDEDQVFNLKLSFKNSSNNVVAINFDSNGKVKYKLGNYVGHACEKTTDKLLDELTKIGYTYPKPLIRRDIDSAKPIMKAFKQRGE